MTAKKKYYTTKNEIISNLQNQLAIQREAHESEIKKLQDENLRMEQSRAYMTNTLKKWSSLRFKADDVWELCNALSAMDVTTILHCFKDKIIFYYEEAEGIDILELDTEVDCFHAQSGDIEIRLVASGDDDE